MQKITQMTIGVEIGKNFKAVLRFEGDDSPEIMKEFVAFQWEEFKKDELMGLIRASKWLETRGIKHELTSDDRCGLWAKWWTRFCLKITKMAYNNPRPTI